MSESSRFRNSIPLTVFQMIFYIIVLGVFLNWALHN